MKIDALTLGHAIADVAPHARSAEERGFDGWFTAETGHDPFLIAAMGAEHTQRIEIGTGIIVAFPRSPMHVAQTANDLQALSEGRFVLGLGSQIKTHIERRFSAEWSAPAARMREFILAMRAIWACWNEGERLDFRGDFYQHTLMTPFFSPEPNPHGEPKVALAAVGPKMTEVAGETCDVVMTHSFTTETYLREHTIPALRAGAEKGGRTLADVELGVGMFVVTGDTEQQFAEVDRGIRSQIAFYASTPAYRRVLEVHGWGDLQTELNAMTKAGKWEQIPDLISDEILDAFAVQGEPAEIGKLINARYGDVADRMSLYTPYEFHGEAWEQVREDLRG